MHRCRHITTQFSVHFMRASECVVMSLQNVIWRWQSNYLHRSAKNAVFVYKKCASHLMFCTSTNDVIIFGRPQGVPCFYAEIQFVVFNLHSTFEVVHTTQSPQNKDCLNYVRHTMRCPKIVHSRAISLDFGSCDYYSRPKPLVDVMTR